MKVSCFTLTQSEAFLEAAEGGTSPPLVVNDLPYDGEAYEDSDALPDDLPSHARKHTAARLRKVE